MADESHNKKTEARRDVLKKSGIVGLGTLAGSGMAAAGDDSDGVTFDDLDVDPNPENWDDDEWEIDVHEGGLQTHKYVGEDALPTSYDAATKRADVTPNAPRYEIVCAPYVDVCLEVELIISWYYVGFEVYVGGVNVAGNGIGREDKFWEATFTYKGVKFTVGLNAEWDGGYDVDVLVNGEACVLGQCIGDSVQITP